ncbi:MAG: deoxyguanosinetriphosphate triphosphohydrolase [Alphaproteobacteria bacterium]
MTPVVKPFGDIAPFASKPEESRGRLHAEPESAFRTVFQRDRDRIIHSGAFRRLKHKTQVFVYHEGDYYRTRLTHSLEVAQIARSICRQLGLNEDLAEALALAHDFGHPPFGHAGEDALAAAMAPYGGFDHNLQSLRLVTALERRYASFDGLNLTWETLEGIAKHNGPLCQKGQEGALDPLLQAYIADHDLEIHTYAGPEAQVAALSDDIAYNNHDIDDGLRAGLFEVSDLTDLPLVGPVLAEVRDAYGNLDRSRLKHETIRRLIDRMVRDLVIETSRRIDAVAPSSADSIRQLDHPVVAFSESMQEQETSLRRFLTENMYRHERVVEAAERGKQVVSDLFSRYMADPSSMPEEWARAAAGSEPRQAARTVADFIAGMTDRFALNAHERLI